MSLTVTVPPEINPPTVRVIDLPYGELFTDEAGNIGIKVSSGWMILEANGQDIVSYITDEFIEGEEFSQVTRRTDLQATLQVVLL